MRNLFRALISVFLSVQLLFGSLQSGAGVRAGLPEVTTGKYSAFVQPFIGTGGIPWMCGMLSPATSAPFGCVRVGPDTCAAGGVAKLKTNTSGYYYEHRHILGFSAGRLSGTGARDYGMFRVTPCAGKGCVTQPRACAYSHSAEKAFPGYYAVYLPLAGCLCEMTAAAHTAVQRYTFRTGKTAGLYLDAASCFSGCSVEEATVSVDPDARALTAEALLNGVFSGRYGGLRVYAYAEWDADTESVTVRSDASERGDLLQASGKSAGALLCFGAQKDRAVTLRMGVSFVSAENAAENLRAETDGKTFEQVYAETAAAWEARLSAIQIEADKTTKEIFYTSLFHAMQMPTDFTDTDGTYRGFDGRVHTADGFTYRTDMSLWDTVRNVHSLYTLISPDVQRDSLESLLCMAEQGGVLPRWPMGCGYSGSMFGNPADVLFAESCLKGVPFDTEKAYTYMKLSSDGVHDGVVSRDGAEAYNTYGYLPDDVGEKYSVSKTLEYSWEDAALATMAEALGYTQDAAVYAARAQSYRNLWDAKTKYFRPRNTDGSWGSLHPRLISFVDDIFGTSNLHAFCEGSARHWRWGTTQDPDALVELFGSETYFVRELEAFMRDAAPVTGAVSPGSGFWIGNQHDIHTPYLFNHADRADLTQKWVRWTLRNRFSTAPDGIDGNDDGGTISAWYVFSAMGFYPIAGTDRYWVGSPCIDDAKLTLENEKVLHVKVQNQGKKNVYVSSVTLNGKALDAPFLTHADIAQGGELCFVMTDVRSDTYRK
ncbi:MAG: GH92 family glycosyl hydrolase [Clostridia bacterium]|nr:GH92 family glycosyl hydrolase [Clostridia bacterium]